MTKHSSTGRADKDTFIYTSEVLLFVFAALLLVAAVPPKTTNTQAVPVKVNLPAPQPITVPITTASVIISGEAQTTAFLAINK